MEFHNHHQSEDTLESSFGYSRKINVKCHQNDLISRKKCSAASTNNKWNLRKNRFHHRRKSSSFLVLCWTSVLYLSLPVPQNAMPVPKVEDHNSLTSAMVSTYICTSSVKNVLILLSLLTLICVCKRLF